METIFKVGDRVFDYTFGWGSVHSFDDLDLAYPVRCLFDAHHSIISYSLSGRHDDRAVRPTLSFTEYELYGFSQEMPQPAKKNLYEFLGIKESHYKNDYEHRLLELIEAYKNEKP